jgi:hypothetical protein
MTSYIPTFQTLRLHGLHMYCWVKVYIICHYSYLPIYTFIFAVLFLRFYCCDFIVAILFRDFIFAILFYFRFRFFASKLFVCYSECIGTCVIGGDLLSTLSSNRWEKNFHFCFMDWKKWKSFLWKSTVAYISGRLSGQAWNTQWQGAVVMMTHTYVCT